MREGRLAVRPHGDEPAGDGVLGGIVVRSVRGDRLVRRRRALEAIGERLNAALDERLEFVAPRRFDKTPLPPGPPRGHYAALLPKRFRNASMNLSRSPSITLCTSVTFISVR